MQSNIRPLLQEEQTELADRLELLLRVGKRTEGTSPSVDISKRPDYFDEKRFESAHNVVNKYYLGMAMSSSTGLMLLVQLEEILVPLLRTGKSRTVPDLYDRYSATALYVKAWYESRFYDPTTEAWRYVSIVRAMHQRIFKIMNEDETNRSLIPECERGNSEYLWVNQYDMAITQFAFIGLFILRPAHCGSGNISPQELSDLIYFWRLLSYQLGIEDRFNLFVYHDDLAKQISYIGLIFDEYKKRLCKPRIQVGVNMAKGILLAFEDLTKDATVNILHNHWYNVISLTGWNELASYEGLGERWKLARYTVSFKLAAGNDTIRRFFVRMYKKKLEKFCNKSDKIRKRLAKKYPDHIFELDHMKNLVVAV